MGERERERDRERQTERDRQRETDRERQTEMRGEVKRKQDGAMGVDMVKSRALCAEV